MFSAIVSGNRNTRSLSIWWGRSPVRASSSALRSGSGSRSAMRTVESSNAATHAATASIAAMPFVHTRAASIIATPAAAITSTVPRSGSMFTSTAGAAIAAAPARNALKPRPAMRPGPKSAARASISATFANSLGWNPHSQRRAWFISVPKTSTAASASTDSA